MHPDLRTLFLVSTVLGVVLGLGLLLSPRARRSEPALSYWAAANFAFVLGLSLISLRSVLSPFLSILVANILVLGGAMLVHEGIVVFDRRPRSRSGYVAVLLMSLLALGVFTYHRESLQARIVLVSVVAAGLGVAWTRALLDPGEGGSARRVFLGLSVVHTLFYVARAIYTLVDDPGASFLDVTTLQALVGFEFAIFLMVFNVAALGMVHERLFVSLDRLASIDPLTEALTRRAFFDRAERLLERARREKTAMTLLLFDLDHFKAINDREGHPAGDTVLREMSRLLHDHLRPGDLFGRLGGEEFVVVLPVTTDASTAAAERIRTLVEASPFVHGRRTIRATVSVGAARFPEHGDSLGHLLASADEALYRAKAGGRNRVELADPAAANRTSFRPAASTWTTD